MHGQRNVKFTYILYTYELYANCDIYIYIYTHTHALI